MSVTRMKYTCNSMRSLKVMWNWSIGVCRGKGVRSVRRLVGLLTCRPNETPFARLRYLIPGQQ